MRTLQRVAMTMIGASFGVVAAVTAASAQVCGDADGNGSVTVTDGVQVLRDAAGLSSTCSERANSCDVDGNGSTSVTDGVNTLRKAADLPITENCPGGGDVGDTQEVTDVLLPFLLLGLKEVPNVSLGSAGAVQPAGGTEDCEDGGSRTTNQAGNEITVTFDACKVSEPGIGSFQLDGFIEVTIGIPTSQVQFELNITDLSNSRLVDFDGTITGTPRVQGGFVVDGGPITISNSEGGPEVFRLTFNDLTVDDDGNILSGSVQAEDTSDSFDLETAELEVEDGTATVHVVRDDATEQDFILNLETGELTPVD
jgi:hypothetical protein